MSRPRRTRIHWGRLMVSSILLFLLVEVALAFTRKVLLEREIHNKLVKTWATVGRLQEENLRLKKEKEALYTPEKIEELAREKLDLVKPDEIAVKVITPEGRSSQDRFGQEKSKIKSRNIWEKIKEEWPLKWLLKLVPS